MNKVHRPDYQTTQLLAAAKKIAARLYEEREQLRKRETDAITDAVNEHSGMPDHYWDKRWKVEESYRTACIVIQELEEQLRMDRIN